MSHNLWYWLLAAAQSFFFSYLLPLIPIHVNWGVAQAILAYGGPVTDIVFLSVGSFIHLETLARIIGLMIVIEGFNAFFAIRKLIAKLIRLAAFAGLLG